MRKINIPYGNTPRWIILSIDILIVVFSVVLSYMLRFNFEIPEVEMKPFPKILAYIVVIRIVSFLIAKTYAGIIRFTSTEDVFRIFLVISLGSFFFVLTNLFDYYFIDNTFFIPFSIIIIDFITTAGAMSLFRMVVKVAYLEFLNPSGEDANVIIFGAGEAGIITKNALDRDPKIKYKVIAFIDDNSKKIGKKLEGVTIQSSDKLEFLLQYKMVKFLVISTQNLKPERKQRIIEQCLENDTKVLNVPHVSKWINGELSFNQIKKVKIEDLLEREVINLDEDNISKQISGKNILITGASGSIGSEIARQLSKYATKHLILLDQAESPLFHLELECLDKCNYKDYSIVLADIREKSRIENIFRKFKPEIIFHAAAYKHVPMMEGNVTEAINTNVQGTKLLADLAIENKVEKFIMISTDKAVKPTSVMGASKRIAEMYVQALNEKGVTCFITTRFGNVLGSNGSVIPIFREQIAKGGPVMVTHPEVTRYFMTIPEACQLVLEAGAMGNGGEIYIFDMGKSIKIVDLAKKMIKLSGLELGKDIQIRYTGLRPGEKLYEELLNDKENTLPTHHPQIMIAKVLSYNHSEINEKIDSLLDLVNNQNDIEVVTKMKQIVPEFISKNSIYEKLDTK